MTGWVTHASTRRKETQLRQSEAMMQFLQLVKLNYKEHREVGFYADKMNISAKYMTTLIKNASGKSALQWIEDYVILDAKAQLSSTVNTIQQITFDLNFPSQSIFGRYFKRAVGMSPTEYRASLRVYQMETRDLVLLFSTYIRQRPRERALWRTREAGLPHHLQEVPAGPGRRVPRPEGTCRLPCLRR